MKLSTINLIVEGILEEGEVHAKSMGTRDLADTIRKKYQLIANEATIYLKTALLCEQTGIEKAMEMQ